MKNKVILLHLLFALTGITYGQINHQWSARIGKSFTNTPERVIVDSNDNIILTGTSISTNDLYSDIILAKFSTEGDSIWAYYIGKTGQSELVKGLCVDDSNNIYITGSYKGIVNFGSYNGTTHTLSSKGDYDLFVARFNPEGQIEWVTGFGTDLQEYSQDLVYNPTDKLLMVVGYNNETSTSVTKGIALTLNPQTGKIENSTTVSSSENLKFNGIELLQTEYQVVGSFSGTLGINQSQGLDDAFVAYIDPEGLQLNVKGTFGNADDNSIIDFANLDQAYNALAFKYKDNTLLYPCENVIGFTIKDGFSTNYGMTGNVQAVAGNNESSFFAGNFIDKMNVKSETYLSDGFNIFIGKNNGSGKYLFLQSFKVAQGLYTQNYLRLTTSSKGKLIMAGLFGGTLKFGNSTDTIVSKSLADIFIAQFDVQSSEADIKDIIPQNISTYTLNFSGNPYYVHVPIGTDLSNLHLNIEISENATISPDPATISNYHSRVNYSVTSEDKKVSYTYSIITLADLDTPSGVKDAQSNKGFKIYPNPATQKVSIKVPEYFDGKATCTIRTLDGRTVNSQELTSRTSTIDISHLQPGAYFITIADEKQGLARKLIKN